MRLKTTVKKWPGPKLAGDIDWDSTTGHLDGSLAPAILHVVQRMVALGVTGWGPQGCLDHPVTDPLRKPEEMALIFDLMGFVLPPELLAVRPQPSEDQIYGGPYSRLTAAERKLVVF